MSISHIQTIVKPSDLIGQISLEMKAGMDARDILPVKAVAPFQRIRDSKTREAHEVTLMWSSSKNYQDSVDYPLDELLRDHAFFVAPPGMEGSGEADRDTVSLKSRVSELESEVQILREQLCRAKGVNDSMWDVVMQRLIKPSDFGENMDDGEEVHKRGRT